MPRAPSSVHSRAGGDACFGWFSVQGVFVASRRRRADARGPVGAWQSTRGPARSSDSLLVLEWNGRLRKGPGCENARGRIEDDAGEAQDSDSS